MYYAPFREILRGPMHNGRQLDESEIGYLPEEFQDNFDKQDEIAFFLRCGKIRELDHDRTLAGMYYKKTGNPYIPSEVRTSVCYVTFRNSLDAVLI
ncbi:hypothetical protein ANME2D_02464 [Candidatus Methanoperedens nitroreducens]|uniref:Uncharacterized protein n=1 Tax=Candidatus Methanoperedens nitratireducens TaxID=1392998 RepID=A0A062V1K9_9EURY|nr:hypothetical protein [Candidatus Methanoperedens nitroreducens]KCZ71262.1 hypothetical protein ANME2D_02464 [Candidatus Methanoperedens nitroreducens]MDJ1420310.1 hypothetical protein [Candidatus Methanoperedens sp.]